MTDVYPGNERRLVLALDFGTTFSGVAYAILDPGQIPKIQSVTRFPGQEYGDFKIPSILVYNEDGSIRAAGAETRSCAASADAEDQDLVSVEWFKLRLCPRAMIPIGMIPPPIPIHKTTVILIADFLFYLYQCAGNYIRDVHTDGASLWQSVQGKIDVVLSHPNGWEGSQRTKMREAAVLAKLVPNDASGHERLHFVTEGEASLHYCLNRGLASDAITNGSGVMIVDCGGGTIDLTTYNFVSTNPIQVEETAAPGCILQGSTQVNARFRKSLQATLKGTKYGTPEDIDAMMERFEKSTKPTFSDPSVRAFIKFGGIRDKDPSVGIRNGAITIEGTDIEEAFKPSVGGIVNAIRTQRRATTTPVDLVFLVGGFAASPWLHSQLQIILKADGVSLSRPGSHTAKAVSEGAVSFYLKKVASAAWAVERVSQLETEVLRSRKEAAVLTGQLHEARAQHTREIDTAASQLHQARAQHTRELETAASQLRAAQEATQSWKHRAETVTKQLDEARVQHTRDLETTASQLRASQAETKRWRLRAEAATKRRDEAKTQRVRDAATITSLESQLQTAREETGDWKSKAEAVANELQEATAQRERDAATITSLDSRLRVTGEATRAWKSKAEAVANELQEATAQRGRDAATITSLESQLQTAREETGDWKSKAEAVANELQEATAQRGRDAATITSLESQLQAAREETGDWKSKAEAASDKLQEATVQRGQDAATITSLESQLDDTREETRDWKSKAEAVAQELQEATAQRGQHAAMIASLHSQLRTAEEETRGWKSRAEALDNQLQASQSSLEETKCFLELRTNELILAQTFLPEVDSVSYTQVLSMVENLNDLGFQLASYIVDNSAFPTSRTPFSDETRASVEEVLGKAMTQTLISQHHAEAPMLVQVALLAAVSAVSFVLIQRWDYAFWPAQDSLLSGIHRKLLDLEPQAASASWRARVRRCIREINRDENIDHVPKASADLLDVLKNTLDVSGGIRSERLSDQEMLKKTKEIVEQCLEFQRVVGEDVASTCFDVLYPFPGETFKSDCMEVMDDGSPGTTESSVGAVGILCTVDLGLKGRDKMVDSNGVEKVQELVFLKARTMMPVDK